MRELFKNINYKLKKPLGRFISFSLILIIILIGWFKI